MEVEIFGDTDELVVAKEQGEDGFELLGGELEESGEILDARG